jgi:hypothetical protein
LLRQISLFRPFAAVVKSFIAESAKNTFCNCRILTEGNEIYADYRPPSQQRDTPISGLAFVCTQHFFRLCSANVPCSRRVVPLRRSSASLPYCRRDYATTVALPLFAAAACGANDALRWLFLYLPPRTSATISPTLPTKKTGFPAFFSVPLSRCFSGIRFFIFFWKLETDNWLLITNSLPAAPS